MSYGQKYSGKSYTMYGPKKKKYSRDTSTGDDNASLASIDTLASYNSARGTYEEDGIVPRALHDLFLAKDKQTTGGDVTIQMTFVEIYNDGIIDLLTYKGSKIKNRVMKDKIGNGAGGVGVRGLTSIKLKSSSHARNLIDAALRRRISSRSHTICTLQVTINPAVKSSVTSGRLASITSTDIISAKLTLVDLAGSGGKSKYGTPQKNLDEKKNDARIAKDIFVFGQCIQALSNEKSNSSGQTHVPYRDSKLTRTLKESVGGNCCTIVLACIAPSEHELDGTLSTLRVAECTRNITNRIKRNVIKATSLTPAEGAALRQENKVLKNLVVDMTRKMQHLRRGNHSKAEIVFDLENAENFMPEQGIESNTWRFKYEKLMNLCKEANMPFDENVELALGEKTLLDDYENEIRDLKEQIINLTIDDHCSTTSGLTMEGEDVDDRSLVSGMTMLSLSNQTVRSCEHIQNAKAVELEEMKQEERMKNVRDAFDENHSNSKSQELESLDNQIADKKKILVDLEKQIKETQELLSSLKSECEELSKANEAADVLKIETQNLEKRAETLKSEIKNLTDEKLGLVAEVEDYQNIADLVTDLNDEKNAHMNTRDKLMSAENTISSIKLSRNELQRKLDEQKNITDKAIQEQKELVEAKASVEAKMKELKERVEEQGVNESLEMRVSELEELMKEKICGNFSHPALRERTNESAKPPLPLGQKRKISSGEGSTPVKDDNSIVSVSRLLKDYNPKRVKMDSDNQSILFGSDVNGSFDAQSLASGKFSIGGESLNSDQRAIRLHAQKLLYWADKNLSQDSESIISSVGFDSDKENHGTMTPGRNTVATMNSSTKKQGTAFESPAPSSLRCICTNSIFSQSGNAEHSEFFLPRLGLACNCGAEEKAKKKYRDPTLVKSFLRSWQVAFLKSQGITTAQDLIDMYEDEGKEVARAMKKWRYRKHMKPARTKSCLIALQIWARTARSVVKSHLKDSKTIRRTTDMQKKKASFLEITLEDSDDVSCMSMHDFEEDVLLEGEYEV